MFLLYADESGSPSDESQQHFVLAGVSVFERKAHWLALELDRIAARFAPHDPDSVELHGSPMRGGKNFWRKVEKHVREGAMEDALRLIDGRHCRIFASVVSKQAVSPQDPVRATFQQLVTRFDHFLAREHIHYNNTQRGMVIFDKTSQEGPIQVLAREFKVDGHDWGHLRNMAEVPAFIDSRAARLIQLADLIAHAMYRHYEKGDSRYFEIIEKKFDSHGGVRHGLHEQL